MPLEGRLGRLVAHRLQRPHEAHAAIFPDIGVLGQLPQPVLETRRQVDDVLRQPLVHHHVDGLQRDGAAHRMPRGGEAVRKLLDLVDGGLQAVGQLGAQDHRAHREQPRRQVLGADDRVGHEIIGDRAPGVARPPEAADDLIRDHRDAVLFQHRQDRLEIALGGRNDPARALNGFRKEARDGVGALALDRLVQLARQAGGELGLGLSGLAIAPVMRAGQVDEARQRQAEDLVVRLARHAGRDRRHAVIGVPARQDLALLRVAFRGVHEPQHLDHGVVRLGARIGVEHLAAREGRDLDQLFRQHHRLVGHPAEKGVIARKAVVLRLGGLGQALVVEARDHVPQARIRIQITVAVHVNDVRPLAMGQHHRAALMHAWQVGEAIKRKFVGPCFPALRLVHAVGSSIPL